MEASNQDTKRDCWCVAFGKFVMYYYLNGVWCILYFYDTMKITVKNFTLDIRYPPHADLGNPRILTSWISYFWKSQTSWIIPDLLDALFLKILDCLSILFSAWGGTDNFWSSLYFIVCCCCFQGNSYNQNERIVCAGYDNGDIKMFDLRTMSLKWETHVKNGVRTMNVY